MNEEFNLSNAIVGIEEVYDRDKIIHIQNVKEFIKRLKDEIETIDWEDDNDILEIIDKLAGEDLIEGEKEK